MKTIFTLLLSAGICSASYAQGHYGGNNNYGKTDQYATTINGHHGHNFHGGEYANQKKIKIERINREYHIMVISIQKNHYMSNRQKRLALRDAQKQRNHEIARLNREYNGYAYNHEPDYGRRK